MTTGMLVLVVIACLLPLSLAVAGWLASRPAAESGASRARLRRLIAGHLAAFVVAYLIAFGWAANSARAQPAPQATPETTPAPVPGGLSVGDGLAMLGIALATGLSVLGASYAVGMVGSAALGAITEKPEMFGRTLIFIGLAEGLAIYGLIVSILLLGRLR